MSNKSLMRQRVERCDVALRHYTDRDVYTNLIDLLADAMHWCDTTAIEFHHALALAGMHYVAGRKDKPTHKRRKP